MWEKEAENCIKEEDATEAIKQLNREKAAVHDKLTTEMLQNVGYANTKILTKTFNMAFDNSKVPDNWKIGIVIPIHKKCDTSVCQNYRGITLFSIASKLYETVIEKILDESWKINQPKSKMCLGKAAAYKITSSQSNKNKKKNKGKEKFNIQAFVDLEQAFKDFQIRGISI